MPPFTVFYAWQSDRSSALCRHFIAKALKAAAATVGERHGAEIRIDSDTQGVPGTPPVSETILQKIDACDVFLADLTFVAETSGGKVSPNPNVLIEYGYALKAKGPRKVLLVMNTAFGAPEQLPFDLRHLRFPIRYDAADGISDGDRRRARAGLAEALSLALETLLVAAGRGRADDRPDEALALMAAFQNKRAMMGSGVAVTRPKAVIDVLPLAAKAGARLDKAAVRTARALMAPSLTALVEESTSLGQWLSHEPPQAVAGKPNPEASWATRLVQPGHLEWTKALAEPDAFVFEYAVEGVALERWILASLRRSGELYRGLGLSGPAVMSLTFEGAEHVRLIRARPGGRKLGTPFLALGPTLIQDLGAPKVDELEPLLEDLWQASGWDSGSPSIGGQAWAASVLED
ncbi:hypothetical protein J2X45_003849 [Caulobacter sp. BE264]|uniref:hypothetical protein n=1 Tax=Caulobacter sp. BE264 TaxID=2817724 RepID=UPI00285DD044|nr:hypothetical protein [Caulobacter sp. BE264]MDR7232739.1 hypothetical protein [Caulobacter sp. BE264]